MAAPVAAPGLRPARDRLVSVPAGQLLQGSSDFYPEERPVRDVPVAAFWIAAHPVTNAEFRRFVKATGHVTVAETTPDAADFPDADPADLVAGSLVFTPTRGPVRLDDWQQWWRWQPGANWRHPEGPGSTLDGRDRHPVVHIAHDDARAYAAWSGRRLPSEAEWEWAARGGLVGARYPWGEDYTPRGKAMANTWIGDFPWRRDRPARHGLTTPVGTYPPNGYGLFDVVGNVWEWTATPWVPHHRGDATEPTELDAGSAAGSGHGCCSGATVDRGMRRPENTRFVIKGGSHLCAPTYCHRYRPAARQGQAIYSTTSHVGFRVAG